MKLILTQEVGGLGAPGDIVEVKDGYGRNFLIPRGFGDPLDQGRRAHRRLHQGRTLQPRGPRPRPRQGDQGQARVVDRAAAGPRRRGWPALRRRHRQRHRRLPSPRRARPVDKRKIIVGNPIKSLGTHQVTVKVHDELDALVNLNVVAG